MREIDINLKENSYRITVESGLLSSIGAYVKAERVLIVTDENVAPLYLDTVLGSLKNAASLVLPAGESTKSLSCLEAVYSALIENNITRADMLIALGGGVIGDLAGLAAATYLRGIRYMQVPTTLLAQVDSAVGGKVAIDLEQGKNLVGAFYQPACVLIDPDTLNTLPQRVFTDGLGEVVKYGCIDDRALFALLEKHPTRAEIMKYIEEIITICLCHKQKYVERDERDTGVRMALNFGHTIGHAIETAQRYEGLRHGEAVAAGMCLMTRLSEERGLSEKGTAERLEALVKSIGLPKSAHVPGGIVPYLKLDKKHLNSVLTCVLLKEIGEHFLFKTDAAFFAGVDAWLI